MALSISDFLERGPATSKEIQAATGLSQAAVSRQLRNLGGRIIKIPNGRSPRYVMTRNAFGGDDMLPLVMIDAHGNSVSVARIRPLAHGGFYVKPSVGMPDVLLGESKNGLFDDLPYFLDDLRPQGFLGRQIAEEMATQSDDFPTDPGKWNANHVGRYLISNGDDLPGNFKFGPQAHLRIKKEILSSSVKDYPVLADNVINGTIFGSSAGGEQPKFTAFNRQRSSHVIVKFSPKGNDAVALRWRDILITEHYATLAIREYNFPTAKTRLIEAGGRLFLESERFDRTGEYGRMPMLSLQSVDAEFTGLGSNWPQVMAALQQKNLVHIEHVFDADAFWNFGRLINNTDMHLGNLSLGIDGNMFQLLPIYDMCSMGFAPKGGEVQPYKFTPKITDINLERQHPTVLKLMAHNFWNRVANDPRISAELKEFLSRGNPIDLIR